MEKFNFLSSGGGQILFFSRWLFSMLLLCVFAGQITAQDITNFIVGGTNTNIKQIPFQVSLEWNSSTCIGRHGCGGSILNSEWILTAAHCVDGGRLPSEFIVHAGSTDQTDNTAGQRIAVDQIIVHPSWIVGSITTGNDIALLHLSQPLCFNTNVQPVAYDTPSVPFDLEPGVSAKISGWGVFSPTSNCSAILQSAQLPIITNADAGPMFDDCGGAVNIPNTMISFFDGISAAGGGDSGGPAFVDFNGQPLLIGITSWGCGGSTVDEPSIYTKVEAFEDFIIGNITEADCSCPNAVTEITQNTTFTRDLTFSDDIVVKSGAELIIESTVRMPQNARILVERNARLVINNGGMVTKGCSAPDWAGIQVLGNNQKAQPAYNGPLTDPDQAGIVWIDNGTVEWARTGISTGGGEASQLWGGLVWTNKAFFLNNRKDVEFMAYKFTTNRSRFFETIFSESRGNPIANSVGVTIRETDDIEFHSCTFNNKDFEGIRTYDAGVRVLDGCNFTVNETGVASFATYPMTNKIYIGSGTGKENTFTDNKYHVNASLITGLTYSSGNFSLDVINNNFSGGDYGVIVDGPSNFRIAGNLFSGVPIGNWIANTGFNNIQNQNLIGCNRYRSGTNIGILAIGENKQMQFLANDFNMSGTGRDFVLTSSYFPSTNGAIAALQGSSLVPASNCFTDPGTQVDILTAGQWGGITDLFTYYHQSGEPPVDCDPEPLTLGNYDKEPTNPEIFTVDCARYGGLPSGFESPTAGDLDAKRTQLQQLGISIATDQSAKEEYYQALQDKEAILKHLLGQALEGKDYTTAETLLSGEQSKAANWAIFGLRMDRKDYTAANQWLNQLPTQNDADIQFRDVQLINILRLQNPATFQLSTTQETNLNTVAESSSPVRGYARGILSLLKDRRFYPETYDFGEERSTPAKAIVQESIRLYPVPATNSLVVTWPVLPADASVTLQVFDMLGRSLIQERSGANDTQRTLNTSQLSDGVYYLVISDKGKPVYRAKFTVQH